MRTCLVSQEYPPETGAGGIGTQTWLKAQGLSQRGHEVHVLSLGEGPEARTYPDGLATIHRIPLPVVLDGGYEESAQWLAYSSAVAMKLHELERDVGFDLIQFPEYGGEGFVFQAETYEQPGRPAFAVQLHGPLAMFVETVGWPDPGSALARVGCMMEEVSMHHADLVLASSHNTAAFCTRRYGIGDVEVIHSAVDTAVFRPLPGPADDRFPKVLFVGNVVEAKGVDVVARAVLELRRSQPSACMRIVGREQDTPILAQILDAARAAGAGDAIEFVGEVPHSRLPDQYAWCDVFAAPSLHEPGPGNIYLEAMSCGRPVVAADSGGAPEVVIDGQTGLLIAPESVADARDALARLADDRELAAELGRRGRRQVEELFSMQAYADRVEELYERAIARRGGRVAA